SVVKRGSHKALDDILESIEEMRHYREHFLISAPRAEAQ
ncbi:oligoribonuclease, partial [Neisseria meningitidis]|nr:oligoribonuclease [Neisseria meningitidis]